MIIFIITRTGDQTMSTSNFLYHLSQKDLPPPPPKLSRWDKTKEEFEQERLKKLKWENEAFKAAFESMIQTLPDIHPSLKR